MQVHFTRCFLTALAVLQFHNADAQWTKKTDKTGLCASQSLNAVTVGNLAYIGAGYSGICPEWYAYNPVTDSWTTLSPYPATNQGQSVGFAVNGKVYVGIGGDNSQSTTRCDNKLYEYTPATNTWVYKTTMPGSRRQECVAFVIDNTAYVGLGTDSSYSNSYRDFYRYDPSANTWTAAASFPDSGLTGARGFAAAGTGYVVGGRKRIAPSTANASAYRYDPVANSWSAVAQVPASKIYAASIAVLGDVPYICMGLGTTPGNAGRRDLYRYNAGSNAWQYIDSLPDNRTWDEGIGFALNGRLYFGFGDDPYNFALNSMMWEYKPASTTSAGAGVMQPALGLYPNPSEGFFSIHAPAGTVLATITLIDATGRSVRSWVQPGVDQKLGYQSVPSGLYTVRVALADGTDCYHRLCVK